MPQTSNQAGGRPGLISSQSLAAGGILVSPNLPDRWDNRAFLGRLLSRIDWAEAIRRRAVQDAITDALVETWIWRAYAFEQARPQPNDFTGLGTPAELTAADGRCAQVALACRNHADALAWGWFE